MYKEQTMQELVKSAYEIEPEELHRTIISALWMIQQYRRLAEDVMDESDNSRHPCQGSAVTEFRSRLACLDTKL